MRKAILFSVLVASLGLLVVEQLPAAGGGDITFTLKDVDPVKFSHDYHLKQRGLKCTACHFSKFSKGTGHEMKKELMTKRDFCNQCHNGMKSFDASAAKNCTRCHRKP